MKFVINRTDAIGDLILTTPMAQAIKENFPNAKVAFLIAPKCRELLLNHPFIDEVIILDPKAGFFKNFIKLWRMLKSVNFYFYVGGSGLPNLVAALSFIPFRGGIKSRWPTFILLNRGVRQKRSEAIKHEVNYNLDLLAPLKIVLNKYTPVIRLTNLEQNPFKKEFVVIHPGMTGHTLNWPSQNYAQFILEMEVNFPKRFLYLISFTPSDGPFLQEVRKLGDKVIFFDGSILGLQNYMSMLSHASLFLGPATGTSHIANALGVKQIAIYSPIKVQSACRWSPFRVERSVVLTPIVNCEARINCLGEKCSDYECMSKISVKTVVETAKVLLNEAK